jgi:hypothetical protein
MGRAGTADRSLPAEVVSVHERIDLPVMRPTVAQHRRLYVTCPGLPDPGRCSPTGGGRCDALRAAAARGGDLSEDLPGDPYERLQAALSDLFGLTLSQGGLMNVLRHAQGCCAREPGRSARPARSSASAARAEPVAACTSKILRRTYAQHAASVTAPPAWAASYTGHGTLTQIDRQG